VVGDDLHGFFLTHEDTEAAMFSMTEDFGFPDSTFTPCLGTGSFVEECFAKDEEFGTEGDDDLLRYTTPCQNHMSTVPPLLLLLLLCKIRDSFVLHQYAYGRDVAVVRFRKFRDSDPMPT